MGRTFDKGVWIGIGLVVGVLVANAVLTYRNTTQLDEDARWVAHTHEVLDVTGDVLRSLVDAETGQRGFTITGQGEFLEPYESARARVGDYLARLKQLTSASERQQERIHNLEDMSGVQLSLLEQGVALRRKSEQEAKAFVASGKSKEHMDAIRALVLQMEQEEQGLFVDRQRKTSRAYTVAVTTGLLAAVFGLITVGAFVWLLHRSLLARQRAAVVLQAQRELFRTTLASIGDGVITTDTAGNVLFLNSVAQSLTGWRQEEAAGLPLPTVFHIVNEQTRKQAEDPAGRALRDGTVVGLANHTVLIAKDGSEKPIDDSAAPIRNEAGEVAGVVLVFRDVTQRRRLEQLQRNYQGELERLVRERTEELRFSEERFRLLVEGTTDYAIFMLDPKGHIISWNPGAQRIKGYQAEEIIGQHFSRFYPPEDIQAGKPLQELEIAAAQGKYEEERWRLRKDGSRFWASVLITALRDEDGGLRGFSKITRDMTQRKEAEETARRLAEEEAARQAIEASAELILHQREQLRVTLESIGDGVIAADAEGKVILLNPVAQALTGWSSEAATGLPLEQVFDIKNERTGERVENPVARVLREGAVIGLGNSTILTARDGTVRPVEDSAAPIKDEHGKTLGVVLVFHDVTHKRRAEMLLRESEERYRQIVETAQEGICLLDAEANIMFTNARMAVLLDCPLDQLPGRPLGDFLEPDEQSKFEARRPRRAQGVSEQVEMRFRRRDGSPLWGLVSASPIYDAAGKYCGSLGLVSDITERRRAERSAQFLADASAALAALVDYHSTLQKVAALAVPYFADWCTVDMLEADGSVRRVAVAHVDPAKVQLAKEVYERFPPNPSAPRGTRNIIRTGQPEFVPEITDGNLSAPVQNPEYLRILRELGLHSYIGVPIRGRAGTLGVLTFVAAESGRNYTEMDLAVAQDLGQRVAIALENARLYSELKEADRKKDEFLAMLAHELRNPLAPIRNAVHILRMRGVDAATATRAKDVMERQIQHMVRLVDDLLDVSRIMEGKIDLRREPVEIDTVVARAVETAQPAIDAQGHELTITLPPVPLSVYADPVRLAQVVSNLLTNAAKYMESGGRIWLSAERQGDELALRVRDAGLGIAPDLLPRVFDLFVQAEHGVGRSQGGLGLGLTLVKRLVEMHGGSVTAHSEGLGKGSEFVVRLSVLPLKDSSTRTGTGQKEVTPLPTGLRRRILVVDDNVDAAESLALLLRLQGQVVRVAHDGPSALATAQAFQPEMVFLDIGMPGMDGYEVARQLRQQPGLEHTTLVALTGWGQEEDRRRSREAGFDKHLIKPVEPDLLRRALIEPAASLG
jgi:PAS domain S-box-containing protein